MNGLNTYPWCLNDTEKLQEIFFLRDKIEKLQAELKKYKGDTNEKRTD